VTAWRLLVIAAALVAVPLAIATLVPWEGWLAGILGAVAVVVIDALLLKLLWRGGFPELRVRLRGR
jgi:hypothetical protein